MHPVVPAVATTCSIAEIRSEHSRRFNRLRHRRKTVQYAGSTVVPYYSPVSGGKSKQLLVSRSTFYLVVSIVNLSHLRIYNGYQRDAYSLRNWAVGMLPSVVYSLTDHNFADVVLRSSTPWVVDYYAPWCGPCQRFAIEYEIAARQFGRRVKFAKVNCESFPFTCQKASVQAYPSIRFYLGKTGFAQQDSIGTPYVNTKKAEDLVEWLESLLSNQKSSHNANLRDEL